MRTSKLETKITLIIDELKLTNAYLSLNSQKYHGLQPMKGRASDIDIIQ